MLNGAHQSLPLLCRQADRAVNTDSEIADSGGAFELFGSDRNREPLLCKIACAQILRCIKGRASTERSQKKLGRSHPGIGSAILLWLIADDRMRSCVNGELYAF